MWGSTTFFVQATSCWVTIEYCYPYQVPPPGEPDVYPKTQLRVERMILQPPCGPSPLLNPWQLSEVYRTLMENLPDVINCNNHNTCSEWCYENPTCFCPDASPHWSVFTAHCVKIEIDTANNTHYIPCTAYGTGGYEMRCISVMQVCCDGNGNIDATFMGMDGDDACDEPQQPGCVLLCPKQQGTLHCCDEDGNHVDHCPGAGQDPNTPVEERTGPCPDPVTLDCP